MSGPAPTADALFRLAGVGVVQTDLTTGRFVRVNEAFCGMVGYSEAELLGMTNAELTHPDDWAQDADTFGELQRGDVREAQALTRVRHKDGSVVWLELSVTVLGEGDGAVNLAVVHDVSKRVEDEAALRASEAKYRTLFASIGEGVSLLEVLFDRDGQAFDYRFVENNPAVEAMTGVIGSAGKTVLELFPEFDRRFIDVAGGVARTGVPARFQHFVPEVGRWFDVHEARVGGEGSHTVIATFADVTERKRREANLALLAEMSEDFAALRGADEIMGRVGERLAGHLKLSRLVFSEVDDAADRITALYEWRRDERTPSALGRYPISALLTEAGRRHYAAGKLAVIPDTRDNWTLAAPPELLFEGGNAAIVDAPHLDDGRWRFLLTAVRSEPGAWRADETELLEELAARIYLRLGRARAEAAVRDSEARLQLIVESAQGYAIFTLAEDGTVSSWNAGAAGIFGWDEAEIVGQHAGVLYTPEDQAAGEPQRELDKARAEGSAPDRRWHLRRDGGRVFIDGSVQPLRGPAGQLGGFVKIGRDLTAQHVAERERERLLAQLEELNATLERRVEERTEQLRHSEQRFAQAFFSNPVPACMTTFGRETFVEVNEAFLALTGYDREAVVGKTAFELGMWSSNDNQRRVNTALAQESGFRELDLQVRVKGGGVRDVLLSAEVIRLDGHDGYLKMFYDVTERKRTEEQLHEAVQQVMTDASWFSRKLMEQLAHIRSGGQGDPEAVELSRRERQILERMAAGHNNDAIAAELGLATQTVRNYISNIYDKLGVHTRTEAVVWARERGIVGL